MSLILSFANGLLSVPVAFIFSYFIGLNGVWIGILVAQYLTLLLAFGMLEFEKLKSKEKYVNLLLLEPNENEILNITLKSDYPVEVIEDTLKEESKLERKALEIATALSSLESESNFSFDIDVRISENAEDLIVNCRINEPNINLENLKSLKLKNIENDKVLGMNEVKITI